MSKNPPTSTQRFFAAVRSGAPADELNALLAEIQDDRRKLREARIQSDADFVTTRIVAASPAVAAAVEVLLQQAKELLEGAA